MKKNHWIITVVGMLSLFLLSGCANDGDGQLELKEPKKELSEMPSRKNWLEMDISDPENFQAGALESDDYKKNP